MLKFFLKLFLKLELSSCFSRLTDVTRLDYAKKWRLLTSARCAAMKFRLDITQKFCSNFRRRRSGKKKSTLGKGKEHAMQALWHDCIFAHTGIPQDCQKCAPKVKCKRQRIVTAPDGISRSCLGDFKLWQNLVLWDNDSVPHPVFFFGRPHQSLLTTTAPPSN